MKSYIKKSLEWWLRPTRFYLSVVVISGVFLCFALPPFRGTDEASHVFRVYQLSTGDLFIEKSPHGFGHQIPDAIQRVNITSFQNKEHGFFKKIQDLYKAGKIKQTDVSTFQTFAGSGIYTPLAYVHYVVISGIARAFTDNSYIYFMFLRLLGLATCVLLTYLAIRMLPTGKWLAVTIGLLPMTIHQSVAVSPDGLLISSVMLFVALILFTRQHAEDFNRKRRHLFGVLLALGTLSLVIGAKPGYQLFLLTIFVLPKKLFQSFGRYFAAVGTIIVVSTLACLSWYGLIAHMGQSSAMKQYYETVNRQQLQTPREIAGSVARHPLNVVRRFTSTYIVHPPQSLSNGWTFSQNYQPSFIFNNFIGTFGSLEIYPPSWMVVTVPSTLLLGLQLARSKASLLNRVGRRAIWGIIIAVFALINGIFWVTWTSASMVFIFGVQGRYFIPLIPLLLFILPTKKWLNFTNQQLTHALAALIVINTCITALSIYQYFYA